MPSNKYSFWRLIAVFCAIFLVVAYIACYFLMPDNMKKVYLILMIPTFFLWLYSVIHQMMFPLDLRIYVIWVFYFSFFLVSYGFTALSLFVFCCGYVLGMKIRYMQKGKVWKLTVVIILYMASSLYILRLSPLEVINCVAEFLMMAIGIVAMRFVLKHLIDKINKDIYKEIPKEDLNSYFEELNFSDRDKAMLEAVRNGCKYEEIAINHNLSISSVKKRLAFLYKKLGVTCQIDFLIKFSQINIPIE